MMPGSVCSLPPYNYLKHFFEQLPQLSDPHDAEVLP
jgi:hypothetical protein